MVRYYLVPKIGSGIPSDTFRPAFLPVGPVWDAMDYGQEPLFLVRIDLTDDEHAGLMKNPEVVAFPTDLDIPLGKTSAEFTAALEALKIPADWLNGSTTVGKAIRGIAKFFSINQRLNGRSGKNLFDAGDIDMKVSECPKEHAAALKDALSALGCVVSINASTTFRDVLKSAAAELPAPEFGKDQV